MEYNFAPASPEEDVVFGACRPEHAQSSRGSSVRTWIEFMQEQGIERICCLLDAKLDHYDGLLDTYRRHFGDDRICHAPIEDFQAVDPRLLHETIVPFLEDADRTDEPTVVHCSAGLGRTGHVLALWLALGRGYHLDDAVSTVRETGRQPLEAASMADLERILDYEKGQ